MSLCSLLRVLPLVLLVAACAVFNPPEKQRGEALSDFVHALRWQQYDAAAGFFVAAHRNDFLAQMTSREGLTVTDVRLGKVELAAEGRRADVRLEMDYYQLPSATVKTLRINQTWVYFDAGDAEPLGFLITTPFPKFP